MQYDPNNIFAKIIKGTIPCKKIFENEHALAFFDISPKAPVHVLVIPKGPYVSHVDFIAGASEPEILAFERAIAEVIQKTHVAEDGFRLITNTGSNGHQEVPHYHVHVLGGRPLGPMLMEKT